MPYIIDILKNIQLHTGISKCLVYWKITYKEWLDRILLNNITDGQIFSIIEKLQNAFPQYMYLLLHDLIFIVMRFATGLSYGLYPHAYIWINQINRYRFVWFIPHITSHVTRNLNDGISVLTYNVNMVILQFYV